jgi:transposase
MSKERRTYPSEFKREAVSLAQTSGKTMAELERELGISQGILKQWVRAAQQDGEQAFPGHGHLKADEERVRQLERELAIVKEERDILKKAIAIFSQTAKRSIGS